MLVALALGSLSVSPLLTSTGNPSNSVLDSGVEAAAAPPRKPFGWDAYWGAADMHAGPSYSFARQRTKIADANARAQTRSVSASAPFVAALAYPPLGELMAVQTCVPLATQHVKVLGTVLVQCRSSRPSLPELTLLALGCYALGSATHPSRWEPNPPRGCGAAVVPGQRR